MEEMKELVDKFPEGYEGWLKAQDSDAGVIR